MNKQKGFTLIELVVVIVILGILAVTAAPRFLNLQSDARASALQGLKGAMAGAASITYGKAAIEGVEGDSLESISSGNTTIATVYGYPAATSAGIGNAVEGLDEDWSITTDATGYYAEFKTEPAPTAVPTECFVKYEAAEEDSAPTITVDSEDC